MMKKLMAATLTLLCLSACAEECVTEDLPEATYDVDEETMAALEASSDRDREELPCEMLCLFAAELDAGFSLEVDACELSFEDPATSEDPDAVVAHVTCSGELVGAACVD